MDTITRTYNVSVDLHRWIEQKAAKEGRSVIRQVERILEDARQRELTDAEGQVVS